MQSLITLAFYIGWGGTWRDRLIDGAIRLGTLSRVSHVELIAGRADLGSVALCWSSSPRDGCVRSKPIYLDPDKWLLVEAAADADRAVAVMSQHWGQGYDALGAVLSPLRLPVRVVGHDRWFCSEIVAEALGWPDPWRWSPARMYRALK